MPDNIIPHYGDITLEKRRELLKTSNRVLWLTGLSGSGKSTIAHELALRLHKKGVLTYVLDGDTIRTGLNNDLGFSEQDREENIRRIAHVAKLLYDAGVFVIVCFISPYAKDRAFARSLIGEDFIEVFVDCPLEECERRDVKGLYAKARAGKIKNFTGVNAPYEGPTYPEIIVNSYKETLTQSVEKILLSLGL